MNYAALALHAVFHFTSLQSIMLRNQPLLPLSLLSVLNTSNHTAPYHYPFSILLSVPPLMSTQSAPYHYLFSILLSVPPLMSTQSAPYHYLFSILLSVPPLMFTQSAPYHYLFSILLSVPPFMSIQYPLHPVSFTDRHIKRAFLPITCNSVSAVRIRMTDCQILI